MTANGTAVEGVCVTRRTPPVECPGCEHGVVPVANQYGAVFAPSCAAGFAIAVYDESL
jgi:hypothetical protein